MNYKKTLAAAIAASMAISSSAFAAASTGAIPESVEKTEDSRSLFIPLTKYMKWQKRTLLHLSSLKKTAIF